MVELFTPLSFSLRSCSHCYGRFVFFQEALRQAHLTGLPPQFGRKMPSSERCSLVLSLSFPELPTRYPSDQFRLDAHPVCWRFGAVLPTSNTEMDSSITYRH